MSDKQVNKNGTVSQMRAISLILSMLLCIAANAKLDSTEYTFTDEDGITISVSDPRYDYELEYNPDYPDLCGAKGVFSFQIVINDPVPVNIIKGVIPESGLKPNWIGGEMNHSHPVNKPFRVSRILYTLDCISLTYLRADRSGFHSLLDDIVFRAIDFISDEDKEKVFAAVEDIVDSDDILKCIVYDLRGFKVAEGITREEAGLHLSHGIYIVETTESNGNIKREKIYVR